MSGRCIALALLISILFSTLCPLTMGIQHSVYTVEAGGGPWNILYENTDESEYSFDLNASAIGIKLVLYMSSRGDANRDWVKIYVYSEVVNTTSEGEERTR